MRESTRRKERGPGGEQREEPIPRVLAPLLDGVFSTITSRSPCCLTHAAAEQHSSRKMGKWAPGKCHLWLVGLNKWPFRFLDNGFPDVSITITYRLFSCRMYCI